VVGEAVRGKKACLQHPLEHLIREKTDIFCKHAEDNPNYEVRYFMSLIPTVSQPLGKNSKLAGRFFSKHLTCFSRAQALGIFKARL
jgi:hypothetical protein